MEYLFSNEKRRIKFHPTTTTANVLLGLKITVGEGNVDETSTLFEGKKENQGRELETLSWQLINVELEPQGKKSLHEKQTGQQNWT